MFFLLAPHVVLPSLTASFRPQMAECPSDDCPSPLMAEGQFFLLFPPCLALACCCVCDLPPGSCRLGSPCDPPVFRHMFGHTARFVLFCFYCFAAVA